ncbi:TonB-dependent receptor [Phenylobacterium sp. 20VBR1]|uniref:TonB-dependent receptor n=1 Tax=Phenylobacterium glaciei TaxID=2803784 RepID=A0A941D0Y5_9CAUL|nr:TonB-dependent receptor [Phenylobacterium glaciei]MBR7618836.1 TonB-dependent receptor [Phenylobacterium glaciei]
MNSMLRTALLGTVAAASLAAPHFAFAQTAGQAVDVEEVVVTGSRIRRDTFNAPVPLSVISGEQIRQSGNVSLAETLLDIPTINAATNAQNSAGTLFLAGQARADIRGLGPSRTLVLMDGRRIVFSDASSPAVDLNLIPSLMVDRIETVAGGASAVYGSEAIAGVVNILMKKSFDGVELDAQAGISQESDGQEFRLAGLYGGKFMDDRLNILIGGEFSRQEPIMQVDRDWAFPGIRRNTLATPQTIIPQSKSNTSPYATFQLIGGALGTARSVTLDVRNPTQVTRTSAACSTATVQPTCQDDALFYSQIYNSLQAKSSRGIVRSYVDYQLTDNIKAFADLSYAAVDGYTLSQPPFSSAVGGGTMPVTLKGDNAYLNGAGATAAALRAEWLAAGKTLTQGSTAQVGKFWREFGGRDVKSERTTLRLVGGMEGKFAAFDRDFNWDWYAQYGKTTGKTTSYAQPILARVQGATDAVLVGGAIVCRDVTLRAAGCVPWDLINGASQEAINYAAAQSVTDQEVKQTVVAANITTNLFELPAGPLGFAMGGEYRKEESRFVQDALGASGALFINPIGTRAGEYDTREGYAELRVPILKDVFLAKELTVEVAGRVADYSTIGKTDQYRVAAEWAPIQDIRFRASQGTAVRAPNIVELFSPQSRNFTSTAIDPCDKDSYAVATAAQKSARNVTCAAAISGYNPATFVSNFGTGRSSLPLLQGGNPKLGPETANTYQVGVVVEPRFIPNLSMSLDFFKYNIENQVGSVPLATLLGALCYDSTAPYVGNNFCAQIRRDPTGTGGGGVPGGVIEVTSVNENVAKVKVEGYDASVQYAFHTADLLDKDYGSFSFRVDATWMYRWALQGLPGQAYTQLANTITNATPEWKAQGTVQWTYQDLGVTWTTHYIGSMASTTSFTPTALSPYYTGDYYSHDLRARYAFNDKIDLRAGVLNITNEAPPYLPETFTGTGVGSSTFDNRGRYYFVGATFRY